MDKLIQAMFSKLGAAGLGGSVIAGLLYLIINQQIQYKEQLYLLETRINKLEWQIELMMAEKEKG